MPEESTLLFRQLFGRFTTGVAVIVTEDADRLAGLTVNSLTSTSLDPPLLLFCARNESFSAAAVLRSGLFSVNVLGAHQEKIARYFSGPRDTNIEIDWVRRDGFVWIGGSNATFQCAVEAHYPGGDHKIIVGRVVDIQGPEQCYPSLVYHQGHYIHLQRQTETKQLLNCAD